MEEHQKSRMEELFDRYRRLVFYIASKRIGNPADCEEIVQEAFVRMVEKADLLEQLTENQQLSYLSRVTENLVCDHLRKKQAEKDVLLTEEEWMKLTDGTVSLDEMLHSMEASDRIRRMLQGLSPADRVLITGRYLLGYSVRELAKQLDCSSKTLSVRLFRARARAILLWKEHAHG